MTKKGVDETRVSFATARDVANFKAAAWPRDVAELTHGLYS